MFLPCFPCSPCFESPPTVPFTQIQKEEEREGEGGSVCGWWWVSVWVPQECGLAMLGMQGVEGGVSWVGTWSFEVVEVEGEYYTCLCIPLPLPFILCLPLIPPRSLSLFIPTLILRAGPTRVEVNAMTMVIMRTKLTQHPTPLLQQVTVPSPLYKPLTTPPLHHTQLHLMSPFTSSLLLYLLVC